MPFYDPFIVLLLTLVYIFFKFLVSIISFLFVLGIFLEDPSVSHFCDVGILIKDYLKSSMRSPMINCTTNNSIQEYRNPVRKSRSMALLLQRKFFSVNFQAII